MANYDNVLDRMLSYHQGLEKAPDTYRVVTGGRLQGMGDVEERCGTLATSVVTILADSMDYLASAQHLAIRLCESMRRNVWVETESEDAEMHGHYTYDAELSRAVEDK